MSLACDILVSVNGGYTDTDVENDSADWRTKVANVKVTGGGGSWWRPSRPLVCSLDVAVPIRYARKIRTVTVAATLEASTSSILPTGIITGLGSPYRIIFNGDVVSAKDNFDGTIKLDAASEMSGLMNRRARIAADATVGNGIRWALGEIETAHSLTMAGENTFPEDITYYTMTKPKQSKNSNGAYIRGVLAGSGINMTEEWENAFTAPVMRWRADYQDPSAWTVTTTRHWETEVGYPWQFTYDDVGVQWQDFIAKILLTGEAWEIDNSISRWGSARLNGATNRANAGYRELQMPCWINTETSLKDAAKRLLGHQGNPNWVKMNQITLNVEHYYRVLTDDGSPDAEVEIAQLCLGMIGDRLTMRTPFDDTHTDYGAWPYGDSGELYDNLESLWSPTLTVNGTSETVTSWVVRAITRTFDPVGGWTMQYGLDPYERVDPSAFDAADVDSDAGDYD